ncbi:hypothetical protein G6M85_21540 [Agrobacterium tumefaciens]|uniref:hypothetical protein n=1 Tax=Agrobacterium tumefaciens TaxID=358 RepID=UPI001574C7AC|nr:hypothetical protein [Agrobacterium tumefaciens]NTE68187.1 hypothetical protein [Agrobacterium tumefaciens]
MSPTSIRSTFDWLTDPRRDEHQLNAFEAVVAYSIFNSVVHLGAACKTLENNCVQGITVNGERLLERQATT